MKLRVCLDTSVFSAYYDARNLDRKSETERFWEKITLYEVSSSEIAKIEISQTLNAALKTKMLDLLAHVTLIPVTKEMKDLAQWYVGAGIFASTMYNDALHVASAVISRQDILLSWNFKHLVNRQRRALINQLNISKSLPTIEILAPPEV